jgi:hypothetical protein
MTTVSCWLKLPGHLPKLVEDLIIRLGKPSATTEDSDAAFSAAAVAHGARRFSQGYSPARPRGWKDIYIRRFDSYSAPDPI